MKYLLRKCDIISVPSYAKRISSHDSAISYRRYITRSDRNGYHCKKPLLSGRQKRSFCCERVTKRSRIEVRKPKISVFALFYKLEPVERFSIDESKDRLAGFLLLHPH